MLLNARSRHFRADLRRPGPGRRWAPAVASDFSSAQSVASNKFSKDPAVPWSDKQVQKQFVDHIAKEKGIRSKEDLGQAWAGVTPEDIARLGGASLLTREYGGSVYKLLHSVYPDQVSEPWRFGRVRFLGPFVSTLLTRAVAFSYLGIPPQSIGAETDLWPERWYSVESAQVQAAVAQKQSGLALVLEHSGSLANALLEAFPEHTWQPWRFRFGHASGGFWKDSTNRRAFFDWLGPRVFGPDFTSLDVFYGLQSRHVMENGGGGMLTTFYKGSVVLALSDVYPNHTWHPWRFSQVPRGFWSERSNQEAFLSWALAQNPSSPLKLSPEALYSLTGARLAKLGGSGLLAAHKNSLASLARALYPQFAWEPWRFSKSPDHFAQVGDTKGAVSRFIGSLGAELSVASLDDWYNVSRADLEATKSTAYLRSLAKSLSENEIPPSAIKSLGEVLRVAYPNHPWDGGRFHSDSARPGLLPRSTAQPASTKKHASRIAQAELRDASQKLFPQEVLFEDHFHPSVSQVSPLDLYFPSLKLALEYHGPQHYLATSVFKFAAEKQAALDLLKRERCQAAGITLVEVPYTWIKGDIDSLANTIRAKRPDLIQESRGSGASIPSPLRAAAGDLGQTMKEKFAALPTGWWTDFHNRRQFLQELLTRLDISQVTQVYYVSKQAIVDLGGKTLLAQFPTVADALVAHFPSPADLPPHITNSETPSPDQSYWLEWRFEELPVKLASPGAGQSWWSVVGAQTKFLTWMEAQLRSETPKTVNDHDMWYSLSEISIGRHGGKQLLELHGSLSALLNGVWLPHLKATRDVEATPWLPWKFVDQSKEWWKLPESQKEYIAWLLRTVHIMTSHHLATNFQEHAYNLTKAHIQANFGGPFLVLDPWPAARLVELFPTTDVGKPWLEWQFDASIISPHWWHSQQNQRKFIEWVQVRKLSPPGSPLPPKRADQLDKFYALTVRDYIRLGGARLIKLFGNSPIKLLQTLYPDHQWQQFRFARVPQGYWASVLSSMKAKKLLEVIADTYGFSLSSEPKDLANWYLVPYNIIPVSKSRKQPPLAKGSAKPRRGAAEATKAEEEIALSGKGATNSSLVYLLRKTYPNHPWDLSRFKTRARLSGAFTQRYIHQTVDALMK